MQWVPFLLYVFVTSFTPGPNNIMSMVYATKHGYRKTLAFIMGVAAGTGIISLASCYFNLALYRFIPTVKLWMSIFGALYMIYLAIVILYKKPGGKKNDQESGSSFLSGFMLQFINPKVILYAITVISTFVIPYTESSTSLVLFALFLGFIGFVSTSSWALFGAMFQTFLAKHDRLFSIAMALLLLYSAALLFME